MSLIGKQVKCTRYPDFIGTVISYSGNSGAIGLKYFDGVYVFAHISECVLVVVIPEREYKELKNGTANNAKNTYM